MARTIGADNRHHGQGEGDVAGVADNASADLDQFELQVGKRPIGL